ncbi:MAG: hypothetical protein U5L95_05160 [Candidatus Saccharibacteria bacterium]|nr:hypothetical protein [Candidatus Saccharibacteria bacterium]
MKKLIRIALAVSIGLLFALPPTVLAQYGGGEFGSCEYGQNCPSGTSGDGGTSGPEKVSGSPPVSVEEGEQVPDKDPDESVVVSEENVSDGRRFTAPTFGGALYESIGSTLNSMPRAIALLLPYFVLLGLFVYVVLAKILGRQQNVREQNSEYVVQTGPGKSLGAVLIHPGFLLPFILTLPTLVFINFVMRDFYVIGIDVIGIVVQLLLLIVAFVMLFKALARS